MVPISLIPVDLRPATKGGPGCQESEAPPRGSNLALLKFSELLFILLYLIYVFLPHHGMVGYVF